MTQHVEYYHVAPAFLLICQSLISPNRKEYPYVRDMSTGASTLTTNVREPN
jgi:hypothetical protein